MKATVVIPNYNGKHFLKPCLDSLKRQTEKAFEILIVDNASSDGSVSCIQQNYPEAKLLILDKNYGFSGAVNAGIKASKTPYVILLNNDTEVDENYITEMIKSIEKSDKIFSVSSKMIQYYDREKLDDAGDLYCLLGWAFQRGVGQNVSAYTEPASVFTACAGAAIYRRKVFDEIGYFDESHFAYLEDIDVGYRAKIYGYRNEYCPTAKVYHVGSGTSGSKYNSFKVRLAARNNIYLNYKNMPVFQLILNFPFLLAGCLIKQLFFIKRGFGKDYSGGIKEGIQTFYQCRKVKFQWKHIIHYCRIEWELVKNTFLYAGQFCKRRWKK
jgi:GT2 family glycosyltransferase